MCFYRRSVNFYDSLQRASPSLLVLLDRPHLPTHPYAELSFTVHPASPTFSSLSVPAVAAAAAPPKCPMELDSCQRRAPGAGGLSFGFLGAESRFQRLENDMRDFKQAMFGASFGSATLLSCPIADSGCTEDHKSNIRTSIMLENNASTMYLLRVSLTGTFNAG